MKKYLSFLLLTVLFSCNDRDTVMPTACVSEMQVFFSQSLKCTDPGKMETHLQEARYDGEPVYFTEIMCIYCGIAPTTFGYNCSREKVEFKNPDLLTGCLTAVKTGSFKLPGLPKLRFNEILR